MSAKSRTLEEVYAKFREAIGDDFGHLGCLDWYAKDFLEEAFQLGREEEQWSQREDDEAKSG